MVEVESENNKLTEIDKKNENKINKDLGSSSRSNSGDASDVLPSYNGSPSFNSSNRFTTEGNKNKNKDFKKNLEFYYNKENTEGEDEILGDEVDSQNDPLIINTNDSKISEPEISNSEKSLKSPKSQKLKKKFKKKKMIKKYEKIIKSKKGKLPKFIPYDIKGDPLSNKPAKIHVLNNKGKFR